MYLRDKKDDDVSGDNDDEETTFDQAPVRVVCPHCRHNIITFIEHESSWLTYTAALVLLFVLGWAAVCVVPIVYPLFKDVVHHCPRCLSVLATRSRVAIGNFRSEVMSFRFGSCVVVLARKYVLLLLGFTLLIGSIHVVRSSASPLTAVRTPSIPATWDDYRGDCGFKTYLGNPIHVSVAFDQFRNKTVRWVGTPLSVDSFHFLWFRKHGSILMRMDPPQFPSKPEMPDLLLMYSNEVNVDALKLKERIGFEATLVEVGRRGAPHTLVLWELFTPDASFHLNDPNATLKREDTRTGIDPSAAEAP